MTYQEAKAEAQRLANELGFDYGVEKCGFPGPPEYRHFMLPRRENRYGFELRCEVVMCEDLAKCKPGHGPRLPEGYSIRDHSSRCGCEGCRAYRF
jgi:hypothetical protein